MRKPLLEKISVSCLHSPCQFVFLFTYQFRTHKGDGYKEYDEAVSRLCFLFMIATLTTYSILFSSKWSHYEVMPWV